MLKKFSKFLLISLLIFTLASNFSICFADNNEDVVAISDTSESNPVETSEIDEISETESATEDNSTTDNTHYGDLYVTGSNIVIDQIVYGSVFAIGNSVEITGQIENDLYVIANTLKIDSTVNNGGFIQGKVYAFANHIYFNGACNYLYSISNNIDMTYPSFVVGNANIFSNNINTKAAFGRELNLCARNIILGDSYELPTIYGNLNYTAPNELEIPTDVIVSTNNITYTKPLELISGLNSISIVNLIIKLLSTVITVLILYWMVEKIAPNLTEKTLNKKINFVNLIKSFGIGLLSIILIMLTTIILLITAVGAKLGIILVLLFAILCLVSVPILSIVITKALKSKFKLEKAPLFVLALGLVSLVLYAVTLIPIAGIILNFIIKVTAIGLIIYNYLPNKELTDEEKTEKAESKVAKKQEKLENNNNNNN